MMLQVQQQQQLQQQQQQQQQQVKPVQKRTKSACVHCQSAKVACSSMRPCVWCIRHGLQDTCVDAPKKERKRKSPDSVEEVTSVDISTINFSTMPTNSSLLNTINFNTIPQYSFTPDLEIPVQFGQAALSIFEDVDDFAIDSVLSSASMLAPSSPPSPPIPSPTVPNLDNQFISNSGFTPNSNSTTTTTTTTSNSSNSLTQDTVQDDFSNIIMAEIKRAQASMENVALLSQVQTTPNLLPNAIIKVPELVLSECNEAFARLMEYNSAQDLVNAQITMLDLVFPQLRALLQRLLILRSATGVPERAARKLECISALNMAKQKRCIELS